jgi:transposase-like protein
MTSGDKSVAELARDLGVSQQTLRRWRLQAGGEPGEAAGPTTDERPPGEEQEGPRDADRAVLAPAPSTLPALREGDVRSQLTPGDRGRDRSVRRLARAAAVVIDVGVAVVTWPARWVATGLRRYADQTDEPPGTASERQDGEGPAAAG